MKAKNKLISWIKEVFVEEKPLTDRTSKGFFSFVDDLKKLKGKKLDTGELDIIKKEFSIMENILGDKGFLEQATKLNNLKEKIVNKGRITSHHIQLLKFIGYEL